MRIARTSITLDTTSDMDVVDLSNHVHRFVQESGIQDGVLLVFTPGSTAGVTTIEFEDGAVSDLKRIMQELVPRGPEYAHDRRWGDGNGYSHVRAALMGPSLSLPIEQGSAVTGTWQQVVLCDFDNRPRQRVVVLQALGE